MISKAFREQPRGISWWLDSYALEQPGVASELSTAGLELLSTLLPSQLQGQPEYNVPDQPADNGLQAAAAPQASLLTATAEEELLIAELIQALPCTAALQGVVEDESAALPEAAASVGPPDLQATDSSLSSADLDQQDFMRLLSIVLAPASRIGIKGLEPLLNFPALLYEQLSLERITCQVIWTEGGQSSINSHGASICYNIDAQVYMQKSEAATHFLMLVNDDRSIITHNTYGSRCCWQMVACIACKASNTTTFVRASLVPAQYLMVIHLGKG